MRQTTALFLILSLIAPYLSALRVISLSPIITELVFAAGQEKQLVGVTRFCDLPKNAKNIKKVGGVIDPQLEVILSLKPDLVLGQNLPAHRKITSLLKQQNINTKLLKHNSIVDLKNNITEVGKLLHAPKEAKKALIVFNASYKALNKSLSCSTDKPVMLVASAKPFIFAGLNAFPSQILNHIGVKLFTTKNINEWPVWSLESFLHNSPSIIISLDGEPLKQQIQKKLKPLKLKRSLKILALPNGILQRLAPSLINDAKLVSELLIKNGVCKYNRK